MSHLLVSFVAGFISGYLLNKISSLFVIVILVILVAGYFMPGHNNGNFYQYLGDVFSFVKNYVSSYHFENEISAIVGKTNLMLIAFLAGIVIGFRAG